MWSQIDPSFQFHLLPSPTGAFPNPDFSTHSSLHLKTFACVFWMGSLCVWVFYKTLQVFAWVFLPLRSLTTTLFPILSCLFPLWHLSWYGSLLLPRLALLLQCDKLHKGFFTTASPAQITESGWSITIQRPVIKKVTFQSSYDPHSFLVNRHLFIYDYMIHSLKGDFQGRFLRRLFMEGKVLLCSVETELRSTVPFCGGGWRVLFVLRRRRAIS